MSEAPEEGWTWLYNSKKWHYFTKNGRSLCGKWWLRGRPLEEDNDDDSPVNCAACRRALEKRKAGIQK